MKIERIREGIKEEVIRHGKTTVNLGLKMIDEAKSDCNASQKMIRWIEDVIKIIDEKIIENQIKAKRALDRNEEKLAREIVYITKILEVLNRKLTNIKEKIKKREKKVLKTIKKIEVSSEKIDELIKQEINIKSLENIIKQINEEYRNLLTLERYVKELNRTINIGRNLIEKTRTIIEEGITSEEIKDIVKFIGEEEIQKLVNETIRHLKRI